MGSCLILGGSKPLPGWFVFDIFSRPAKMAVVALPLVRQSPLNPEEKTCSVLVYWWTSLHIMNISNFTCKHLNELLYQELSLLFHLSSVTKSCLPIDKFARPDGHLWKIGRLTSVFLWFSARSERYRAAWQTGRQSSERPLNHKHDKITKTWVLPVFSPV